VCGVFRSVATLFAFISYNKQKVFLVFVNRNEIFSPRNVLWICPQSICNLHSHQIFLFNPHTVLRNWIAQER